MWVYHSNKYIVPESFFYITNNIQKQSSFQTSYELGALSHFYLLIFGVYVYKDKSCGQEWLWKKKEWLWLHGGRLASTCWVLALKPCYPTLVFNVSLLLCKRWLKSLFQTFCVDTQFLDNEGASSSDPLFMINENYFQDLFES